jgi:hypothetical protein
VDPADLGVGDGEHPEGVVVAQVGLAGEGEARQVGQGAAVLGADPGPVEGAAVELDVGIGVPEGLLQPAQLQVGEFLGAETLLGVERPGLGRGAESALGCS